MKQIFKVHLYGSAGERVAFLVKLNVGLLGNATENLHRCIREVTKENYFGYRNEFEVFWRDDVGDPIKIANWRDLQNFCMYQSRRMQDYLKLFVHPKGHVNGDVFASTNKKKSSSSTALVPVILINRCR